MFEQIASELGVRFLVEGSVRRSGDRLRVTAQLIDSDDGSHIWADRYDGELMDVFEFQDRIASAVASAVDPAIIAAEAKQLAVKAPASFDAWDHLVRGRVLVSTLHEAETESAIEHLGEAVALDPSLAEAHAQLGFAHFVRGWVHDRSNAAHLEQAITHARAATAVDPFNATAHCVLSYTFLFQRDYRRARAEARLAVEANPSSANSRFAMGLVNVFAGDPYSSIDPLTLAHELDPSGPLSFVFKGARANANYLIGDFDAAVVDARDAISRRSGYMFGRLLLTASLAKGGAVDEARAEVAAILAINPDFSVEMINQPYQPDDLETLLEGLGMAGLTD